VSKGVRFPELRPPRDGIADVSGGTPAVAFSGPPSVESHNLKPANEIRKILLAGMLRGWDGQQQAVEQVRAISADVSVEEIDGWMQALAIEGLPEWLKPGFWTTEMDQILVAGIREGTTGEQKAVYKIVRICPDLRVEVVWARVRHLRPLKGRKGRRGRPFEWTPQLDATLIAQLRCADFVAAVSAIQKMTGYPRDAILRRARKLGLGETKLSARRTWKAAELRFLAETVQHLPVRAIANELRRTEKAVWRKLESLGLSAKCGEGFTITDVMSHIHVSHSRLKGWINQDRIKVGRNGRITERSLRSFFRDHRGELHWELFDADTLEWLADLGIESTQPKMEAAAQTA
jgi:hypothetical protein